MQKLGKTFPDHLQKSALILIAQFYGQRNRLLFRRLSEVFQTTAWPDEITMQVLSSH